MGHLSLVLVILVFGVGIAASSQAVFLYYRFPIRYLKIHSTLLILLNAAVFFGLLFNYLQINLMNQWPVNTIGAYQSGYYFMLSALTVFIFYFFGEMIFNLLKLNGPRKWRVVFWIYFGGLILGEILSWFAGPPGEGFSAYMVFLLAIAVSFFLGSYGLIFLLFFRAKAARPHVETTWLRTLSLFLLLIVSASLCLDVFQIRGVVTLEEYLLYKSAVIFILNLVSMARLKGFISGVFPQETGPESADVFRGDLFEEYKLTQREQQVVRLICSGKSSRDIEKELFLSPHTIKEYIYRIYKKTGVKNRVQMVNLFRRQ